VSDQPVYLLKNNPTECSREQHDLDEAVAMLELGTPQPSLEEGSTLEIDAVGNEAGGDSMTTLVPSEPALPNNKEELNTEASEDLENPNVQVEPPSPTDDNGDAVEEVGLPDPDPDPAPEHDVVGKRSKAESVGDIPDAD
jgi:hypothetical protein